MSNEKPSYLMEMLTSSANLHALLGGTLISVIGAIPFGLPGLVVPAVCVLTAEVLAALVIPDLPSFRAKVDERLRRDKRNKVRMHLVEEISKHIAIQWSGYQLGYAARGNSVRSEDAMRVKRYNEMIERIRSLAAIAEDNTSQLGQREIERLHDAAIDYLALWLARLSIDRRQEKASEGHLHAKIAELDSQLARATPAEASHLRRARKEYADMLASLGAMNGKSASIDAALMSMPHKIDEFYQMVIAAPRSSGLGDKLEDSLSRLRIEEALENELSGTVGLQDYSALHDTTPAAPPVDPTKAKARAASKLQNRS